jgi:hypothetical protein
VRSLAPIGLVTLALALAGSAAAAGPPPGYWTSEQAMTVLRTRGARVAWVERPPGAPIRARFPVNRWAGASSAACLGIGRKDHGLFAAFRCGVYYPPIAPRIVLVRIWSRTEACISEVSVLDCPPPPPEQPLRGDPRRCRVLAGVCMARTAAAAVVKAFRSRGQSLEGSPLCLPSAPFTYTCSSTAGTAAVRFVKGAASWSLSVSLPS